MPAVPVRPGNIQSKVILRLCEAVNALIADHGSAVAVTPVLPDGVPIAEISVDGNTITLYAPGGNAEAFVFHINDAGHLILTFDGYMIPRFHISDTGHLIFEYEGSSPPALSVNANGHLIRTFDAEGVIANGGP